MNSRLVSTVLVLLLSFLSLSCSKNQAGSDLHNWTVEYGYTSDGSYNSRMLLSVGVPSYAKAIDNNGKVVAEARLLGFASNENNVSDGSILIEETHYGTNRNIVYRSNSHFNRSGIKISEIKKKGVKQLDFFPQWPMGRMF